MTGFPGPRPMHGDEVRLTTNTASVTFTGDVISQGVLRDGRGFVELTLPDVDPQQRREVEWAKRFQYELYRSGALLYSSPSLTLSETRRTSEGFLVIAGSP
ncbi:hypothetical protein [Streptomyces sp. ITFR-16]|uniref:hypothetical protein n=1 Tax=Streptomyces sp. ITFR-16 TaxID=3075198 RepID=UPI00288C1DCB|nr:hypothetical protein [Streptomyces sp. ITFR-16]WNI27348.1 hypothetical protein RLT58_36020 [Streptomyces sp. ITFR-16]